MTWTPRNSRSEPNSCARLKLHEIASAPLLPGSCASATRVPLLVGSQLIRGLKKSAPTCAMQQKSLRPRKSISTLQLRSLSQWPAVRQPGSRNLHMRSGNPKAAGIATDHIGR